MLIRWSYRVNRGIKRVIRVTKRGGAIVDAKDAGHLGRDVVTIAGWGSPRGGSAYKHMYIYNI